MTVPTKIILIAGLLALNAFAGPTTNLEEFRSAREQSDIDKERDGTGCYMECKFDPFFDPLFHPIMGECFKSLEEPEAKTFETILALDANGSVNQSWLDLETKLSECAVDSIIQLRFPEPPFAPYHARITVSFK